MKLTINQMVHQITSGRVIALLSGQFPVSQIIEIGDALLAAPAPAVEVDLTAPNALETIRILSERAGEQMLVGAGLAHSTVEEVALIAAAGAKFVTSSGFNSKLNAQALSDEILYIPGVFTLAQAQTAVAAGCRLARLSLADAGALLHRFKLLKTSIAEIEFIPVANFTTASLINYVTAGAAAVEVGQSLISGPDVTMAEIISRVRALQAVWE